MGINYRGGSGFDDADVEAIFSHNNRINEVLHMMDGIEIRRR